MHICCSGVIGFLVSSQSIYQLIICEKTSSFWSSGERRASSIFQFHQSHRYDPYSVPSLIFHHLLISDNDTDSDSAEQRSSFFFPAVFLQTLLDVREVWSLIVLNVLFRWLLSFRYMPYIQSPTTACIILKGSLIYVSLHQSSICRLC